jgi:hypothetical protein
MLILLRLRLLRLRMGDLTLDDADLADLLDDVNFETLVAETQAVLPSVTPAVLPSVTPAVLPSVTPTVLPSVTPTVLPVSVIDVVPNPNRQTLVVLLTDLKKQREITKKHSKIWNDSKDEKTRTHHFNKYIESLHRESDMLVIILETLLS